MPTLPEPSQPHCPPPQAALGRGDGHQAGRHSGPLPVGQVAWGLPGGPSSFHPGPRGLRKRGGGFIQAGVPGGLLESVEGASFRLTCPVSLGADNEEDPARMWRWACARLKAL